MTAVPNGQTRDHLALIDKITRDHGDIESWVDRRDAAAVQRLLVAAGAIRQDTQPPEEATEFSWDGTWFSTAYFDARPDGASAAEGR